MEETYKDLSRRARFKNAVIKRILNASVNPSKAQAKADFEKTFDVVVVKFKQLKNITDALEKLGSVNEGFTRLDALNRIGNTVFGRIDRKNLHPTNAPVNYPQIWSVSWFDWVQFDGSIMQPLIRNAGEALGVNAWVELENNTGQFASSVNFENLDRIEKLLAGPGHPQKAKAFPGLKAPKWPQNILGKFDKEKVETGKKLYGNYCGKCHGPAISSVYEDDRQTSPFWLDKYWIQINGKGPNYYRVNIIPAGVIGTDSAQSMVLPNRKIDISKMGMDGEVCGYDVSHPVPWTQVCLMRRA